MNTYYLTPENKTQKNSIINEILTNNGYEQQPITHHNHKHNSPNTATKTKWTTFTCYGPDTWTITKLFRNTNLKIAYKTTNTIKHHLKPKTPATDIYNKNGVYQLKCNECPMKYLGQTGRTFRARFKEHIQDIKNNKSNSKFEQLILDTGHAYNTIDQTMKVLHIEKKRTKTEHSQTL
jgi:hypothetical protein